MRPPLQGRRDAARRLLDGVRRTAAELIAPAPRDDDDDAAAAVAAANPAHPAGGPADSDARIDAARDRLRGSVPPQNGDGAEER